MTEPLKGWGAWDRVWKSIPTQINRVYWKGRDLVKEITKIRRKTEYGRNELREIRRFLQWYEPQLHYLIKTAEWIEVAWGKIKAMEGQLNKFQEGHVGDAARDVRATYNQLIKDRSEVAHREEFCKRLAANLATRSGELGRLLRDLERYENTSIAQDVAEKILGAFASFKDDAEQLRRYWEVEINLVAQEQQQAPK